MTDRPVYPIFNLLSDVYDNSKLFPAAAERLIAHAKIIPGQCVLDVACGTGWATMAAAQAVGDNGRVTGIDIATKMLDIAKKKIVSTGLANVEYRVGNAEALPFEETSFDVVTCALSIFFLSDMLKALQDWHRVLKIGGTIAFSSINESFNSQTIYNLFYARLARYEGQTTVAKQPRERVDIPDGCRELLKHAGFGAIEVSTEQLGGYFQDTADIWRELTSTIAKLRLDRLGPVLIEKFKAEYLNELESLRTERGIWVDRTILFSIAKK
jgi:ubiquinone/menaquinone biosynthesis C-methylase UbiE